MARIRSIKPDFFRHELLQDLEASHPELKPMLVFAGLWGQCDKNGVFEYKPRQLKLDILPFLEFDMSASLLLLQRFSIVSLMVHGEKVYGFIPSFKEHQRIHGKESQDASKFPQPSEMTEWKQQGSDGEAPGKQQGRQEGKGREGKGTKEKKESMRTFCPPTPDVIGEYMLEIGYHGNAQQFWDHYQSNGWMVGRNKMKDWKATVRKWRSNGYDSDRGSAKGAGAKASKPQNSNLSPQTGGAGFFAGDFPDRSSEW